MGKLRATCCLISRERSNAPWARSIPIGMAFCVNGFSSLAPGVCDDTKAKKWVAAFCRGVCLDVFSERSIVSGCRSAFSGGEHGRERRWHPPVDHHFPAHRSKQRWQQLGRNDRGRRDAIWILDFRCARDAFHSNPDRREDCIHTTSQAFSASAPDGVRCAGGTG